MDARIIQSVNIRLIKNNNHMGHLFLTIKYLLKDLKASLKGEPISPTVPPGVSKIDWKSDLLYLSKLIKIKTNSKTDLLSYISLDPKLLNNPRKRKQAELHINQAFSELKKFEKTFGAKSFDNWDFNEQGGGFINKDNSREQIILGKKSQPFYVAKELWRNKNKYATTNQIANRVLDDIRIDKAGVRKAIHEIKNKLRDAEENNGYSFPYEIVRPDDRNAGVGLFDKQ